MNFPSASNWRDCRVVSVLECCDVSLRCRWPTARPWAHSERSPKQHRLPWGRGAEVGCRRSAAAPAPTGCSKARVCVCASVLVEAAPLRWASPRLHPHPTSPHPFLPSTRRAVPHPVRRGPRDRGNPSRSFHIVQNKLHRDVIRRRNTGKWRKLFKK